MWGNDITCMVHIVETFWYYSFPIFFTTNLFVHHSCFFLQKKLFIQHGKTLLFIYSYRTVYYFFTSVLVRLLIFV
jgi:hypothetical protein